MSISTSLIISILIIIGLGSWINRCFSFIGRHKKLYLLTFIIIFDIFIIYFNITLFTGISTEKISQKIVLTLLCIVLTLLIYFISFTKALKIIGERKMDVTTLVNCRIYNRTIFYTLQGMSLQGKKNTFTLFFKDGRDFNMAIMNGVNSFNIRYFLSSKRIESVTLLPNGVSQEQMNEIVQDNLNKQKLRRKK